ncbi:MAG: acetyltransferase [Aequorivita sp.]
MNFKKRLSIVGSGGFAKEVLILSKAICDKNNLDYRDHNIFLVEDGKFNTEKILGIEQLRESEFDPEKFQAVIAIGDPVLRRKIVEKLPSNTEYAILVHPNADLGFSNKIGEGTIITSGVIVTCNVKIGKHVHLNLNTTVGHDSIIQDFVTTAPAVNISGNCNIGLNTYVGTGAVIKENLKIEKNSVIGMGAVVVKNIDEAGTYVGNPAKKL